MFTLSNVVTASLTIYYPLLSIITCRVLNRGELSFGFNISKILSIGKTENGIYTIFGNFAPLHNPKEKNINNKINKYHSGGMITSTLTSTLTRICYRGAKQRGGGRVGGVSTPPEFWRGGLNPP